jgi:hypothetical protein
MTPTSQPQSKGKEHNMNIISAFATAWKDAKTALAKADAWITKEQPVIQGAVTTATAVIEAAIPGTGALTTFDNIEEAIFGEIAAAVHAMSGAANTTSTPVAVTFSAEASAAIKALVTLVSGHPAVTAVVATPAKS